MLVYQRLSGFLPSAGVDLNLQKSLSFRQNDWLAIRNVLVDYHVGAAVNVASCAMYLRNTLLSAGC